MFRTLAVMVAICTLGVPALAQASSREVTATRAESISAAGIRYVRVTKGTGRLTLTGAPNVTTIRASGVATAYPERLIDQVTLSMWRRGDTLVIQTPTVVDADPSGHEATVMSLDFNVVVPSVVEVSVHSSSGDARLSGLAALHIVERAGDLSVGNVAGDVGIRDGMGDLKIRGVGGNIEIERWAGFADVATVGGAVLLQKHPMGNLTIADVTGNVHINRHGLGLLFVNDVGGSFTLDESQGDRFQVQGVRGGVSLPGSSHRIP